MMSAPRQSGMALPSVEPVTPVLPGGHPDQGRRQTDPTASLMDSRSKVEEWSRQHWIPAIRIISNGPGNQAENTNDRILE